MAKAKAVPLWSLKTPISADNIRTVTVPDVKSGVPPECVENRAAPKYELLQKLVAEIER